MGVEAIARVVRTGGEAANVLKDLNAEARQTLELLAKTSPAVAQAKQAWDSLNAQLQGGRQLTAEQQQRYQTLTSALANTLAQQQGARVTEGAARPGGAAPEAVEPPAPAPIPVVPPRTAPATPGQPLPVTEPAPQVVRPVEAAPGMAVQPEAAAEWLRRGYTEEEIQRAHEIRPGTIIIPQPDRHHEAGPEGMPGAEPETKRRTSQRADEVRREAESVDRAVEQQGETYRKVTREKLASISSEKDLRREWQANRREIREQERDYDVLLNRLQRLRNARWRPSSGHLERIEEVQARLRDAEEGRRALYARQQEITDQAERFGYRVEGGQLVPPDSKPNAFQKGAGAFLAGAGIGGGSMGGTIAGAVLGTMRWPTALLTLAGMSAGWIYQKGQQAYGTEVEALRQALPLFAMGAGNFPHEELQRAASDSAETRLFRPTEILSARRTLARATGMSDVTSVIAPTATITGQTLPEEVSAIAALTARAARRNPLLSANLFSAYSRSGVPEHNVTAPLGMSTFLYPQFVQAVGQAVQSEAGPFTAVPPEGAAAQLAAATRIPIPGVEEHSPAALDIATARLTAMNQFVGGMGQQQGPLGDLAYFSIRQLRDTPAADRLRDEFGIDINTPLGVYRAAQRAPELAARGMPEIADTLQQRFEQMYPDKGLRELVAFNATGDAEAAAFITSPAARGIYRARPGDDDEQTAERLRRAQAGMAKMPGTQHIWERELRPEVQSLQSLMEQSVGHAATQTFNDIRQKVFDAMEAVRQGPDAMTAAIVNKLEEILGHPMTGPDDPVRDPYRNAGR